MFLSLIDSPYGSFLTLLNFPSRRVVKGERFSALNQMIGFSLAPLPAGQVLETDVQTHRGLCQFNPDNIWFFLHRLFASGVSSPFSLCPLGLLAKIFGKILVIVLPL